ncbi:MAG TPA: pyridoxal-dependent decarboxylase, partial [Dokdonella sp.]|uniref:pyridoxal-dependent decarboxylase n=1 Tax=Dokdonella sp. TaxID=2291710 RepID=UPI002D80B15D
LALKAFPVALRAAGVPDLVLPEDDWSAFNLHPRAGTVLLDQWQHWLAQQPSTARKHWRQRVQTARIEHLGMVEFFARHPTLRVPLVLAPVTAHYSWSKGLKLLGLGRAQMELLPESGMRLDTDALESILERCRRERQPVLMSVAVLGTTEYGTFDPVDRMLAARERAATAGLGHSVHVDAAWGGYLATVFRNEDGSLRSRDEVAKGYNAFPAPEVYAAIAALADTDSVTIDPHKLGYLPFGTGAFVCRDHRVSALLAEEADYVFSGATAKTYVERYRGLGQFVPEGSKSGANAAAVYVTHRVLPLDHRHFGHLTRQTILAAEAFHLRATRFAKEMGDYVTAMVPFPPDSNLVCLALNPRGNTSVAGANVFVRRLHDDMRADPRQPLQLKQFFASMTTLRPEAIGDVEIRRVFDALGLDTASLDDDEGNDRVVILRHTLMNPYLIDHENDISYIDLYFDYLQERVRQFPGPGKPTRTA